MVTGLGTGHLLWGGGGGYSLLIWVRGPSQVVFSHSFITRLWEYQKGTLEL